MFSCVSSLSTSEVQGPAVLLFANPNSGSKKSKKYLELNASLISLKILNQKVDLYIFNLCNQESLSEGVLCLQSLLLNKKSLRVVVTGGDGSLVWVIQEMLQKGIDTSNVPFGIMPFGTGNDLSAMLGWGRKPPKPVIGKHNKGLLKYLKAWLDAQVCKLDIWEVTVEVQPEGHFEKVKHRDHKFERERLKDPSGDTKVFQRLMTNYFSVGLDARIGLGFEKRRTNSKWKNKILYTWEGFKKILCMTTPTITKYTASFRDNETCIFNSQKPLSTKTSVLVALNARTYAGGKFIWDKSKDFRNYWSKPSPCDGKLEFLTFEGVDLAQEMLSSGKAKKLHQGSGPFELAFKPEVHSRVYMQIDGEYFYAIKPKGVKVKLLNTSQKVLVNPSRALFSL